VTGKPEACDDGVLLIPGHWVSPCRTHCHRGLTLSPLCPSRIRLTNTLPTVVVGWWAAFGGVHLGLWVVAGRCHAHWRTRVNAPRRR
jgi:hypothetical protein